jgi:acetyl-CoA carboxylase, biotin carboxylase subunit
MTKTTPQAINRLLIANRGEIALRIQRACRELGVQVVQAYSEADRDSLPVQLADHAVCIGPARAAESYLLGPRLVEAAIALRAQAIHPGYGFLSENAGFAQACDDAGMIFVGPSANVIATMGDKAQARATARAAGVPVTPGSTGTLANAAAALDVAERIGYPVILKAVAGGGGRGMRIVERAADLASAFDNAAREALSAFGDATLYVEKYLERIRHVEIQVLSDGETTLNLGERDCSSQRRNQKLVEEAPAPGLSAPLRDAMGDAALRLCRHVGYTSAGTIECIVDPAAQAFYFMEMNTRIQVEHPVTECVTGIDIVKGQIRIAAGERLALRQHDVQARGHCIECRINAEDPQADFAPSPGTVTALRLPGGPGLRIDTHLFAGYTIPPHYDSLLAKLLTWGGTRDEALARMLRALTELRIDGVTTTAPFLARLLRSEPFRRGAVHTRYVEEFISVEGARP